MTREKRAPSSGTWVLPRVDKQECATPGWVGPRRNFLLTESFRRCTRCESFGKFCLVHLAALYIINSVPSTCSHTALRQNARFFLKKGDVNKKNSATGRGICRLCRRDMELHTLVYLLLVLPLTGLALCSGWSWSRLPAVLPW